MEMWKSSPSHDNGIVLVKIKVFEEDPYCEIILQYAMEGRKVIFP